MRIVWSVYCSMHNLCCYSSCVSVAWFNERVNELQLLIFRQLTTRLVVCWLFGG